jgi:flagellum-specific peptidoglycan hydrolase FlgJ
MLNINQLTEQLRMMPDPALQRMGQMYKNDPYILPMVISEDTARKKMRQAAQAQMAQPQPKVVDKALAAMGTPPQPAPGIAGLQAPNMEGMADGGIAGYAEGGVSDTAEDAFSQGGMFDFFQRSEPVVRMADGGVARYQKGGDVKSRFVEQYRDVAEKVGTELGVDPDIILSQWGLESGWGTKTIGQYNLGNIKDVTGKGKKAFDKLEGSEAAYKSYKSPEDFARDYTSLVKRNFPNAVGAGRDLGAFTEGLSSGRIGTYATDPDYGKKLAATLTSLVPVGSAQAAQAASAQAVSGAQIPGQAVQAPPAVPEGFFSRVGSGLGMSEETKRNIGNILMAPTPMAAVTAPGKAAGEASGIQRLYEGTRRFFGSPSAARTLTPEEIQAMQVAAAAGRNTKAAEDAAEAARMAGAMSGEAQVVSQAVMAERLAEQAAKAPSAAERIQLLQQAERAREAARAATVASPRVAAAQTAKNLTAAAVASEGESGRTALPTMLEQASYSNEGRNYPAPIKREDLPKDVKKEAIATAKEELPKKDRKGLSNDDLVEIGLRMMADPGRSGEGFAGFLGSAGRAGLGALAARKEREKVEREEAKALSEEKYRAALTREAEGKAAMYEEGTRGKTAALQQANVAFANWEKGLSALQKLEMTEEQRKAKYDEILRQTFAALGLEAPGGVSSKPTGASVDTTGFRVLGVRNP